MRFDEYSNRQLSDARQSILKMLMPDAIRQGNKVAFEYLSNAFMCLENEYAERRNKREGKA